MNGADQFDSREVPSHQTRNVPPTFTIRRSTEMGRGIITTLDERLESHRLLEQHYYTGRAQPVSVCVTPTVNVIAVDLPGSSLFFWVVSFGREFRDWLNGQFHFYSRVKETWCQKRRAGFPRPVPTMNGSTSS